jgi:hypothetical protein
VPVLLPDRDLVARVAAHPWARDAHGVPVPPNPASPREERGPWPGAAAEQLDGTWTLRADPRVWPLQPGDVLSDGSVSWTVATALLRRVPGHSDADYVQVTAVLDPPRVP